MAEIAEIAVDRARRPPPARSRSTSSATSGSGPARWLWLAPWRACWTTPSGQRATEDTSTSAVYADAASVHLIVQRRRPGPRQASPPGTSLGLTTTRAMVAACNGSFRLRTASEGGVSRRHLPAECRQDAGPPSSVCVMRIVVCDDHLPPARGARPRPREPAATRSWRWPDNPTKRSRRGEHQPDVCLLDVNFPGGNSVWPRSTRSGRPLRETKVVMLSAEADHAVVGRAIAEGASGYVGKEKPIVEIVEMLDRAVHGQLAVEPALLQRALRPQKTTEDPLWALQFLTDREWQVMRCIMDGQTTEEMAGDPGRAAQHRAHPRPEPPDQARGPLPAAGRRADVRSRHRGHLAGARPLTHPSRSPHAIDVGQHPTGGGLLQGHETARLMHMQSRSGSSSSTTTRFSSTPLP